jgi:segregation and condensation protein B
MSDSKLEQIIEAAIFAADEPLNIKKIEKLFVEDGQPERQEIKQAIVNLTGKYQSSGIELVEVASGFRFQTREELSSWIKKLWDERPPRYSKAFLETLAIIAYRQPITRGEIEEVRGVAVSSNIMRSMLEREWVRVLGQKDVPGRPALYGTTKEFLNYFNLKNLSELPSLIELSELGFADNETLEQTEPAKPDKPVVLQ